MKKYIKFIVPAAAIGAVAFAMSFVQPVSASKDLSRDDVKNIVRELLSEEPGLVMEALQAHQAKEQERQAEVTKASLQTHRAFLNDFDKTPFLGNPKGDVVVIEFFDYNCGFCKRVLPDVLELVEKNPNVKVMMKELPILSEESNLAARFALAAHKQGKYTEYHSALMDAQGGKNEARLISIARGMELDVEKLKRDANSAEIAGILDKNREVAQAIGVRGTPAFIFGDEIVPGALDYAEMQRMVDQMK